MTVNTQQDLRKNAEQFVNEFYKKHTSATEALFGLTWKQLAEIEDVEEKNRPGKQQFA